MGAELQADVLAIDCAAQVLRITQWLRETVGQGLQRRGLVLGLSGGVDSSVCAALAVRALGAKKVLGLLMPEQDSSSASVKLGSAVAQQLKMEYRLEDIGPGLTAVGCYRWRDAAMAQVFPEYGPHWKSKIALSGGGANGGLRFFKLVVQAPGEAPQEKRLPIGPYLQIVASTNFKQRMRKMMEYFHADRLNFAVIGTPNRLEYDQGFFVKQGDGAADVKPIAHLYKSQVYALARYLDLPREVCEAVPTTDTYSLAQGQDEFYFALPYAQMDLALWAYNHRVEPAELGRALGLDTQAAELVYADIAAKRRAARYLHAEAYVVEPVVEVDE
jgi:NAD+ synthase